MLKIVFSDNIFLIMISSNTNELLKFCDLIVLLRIVELQQKAIIPMAIFLKTCCLGSCTGISFIDSTPLRHVISEGNDQTRYLKV